jgi:predicted CXXCH cytochrome family protein
MSAREDCTDCHDPHGADKQYLVKGTAPQLCYECHGDIEDTVASSKIKHKVITEDRSCLGCHVPHASQHGPLLKQVAATLCNECHTMPIDTPTGTIKGIGAQIANSGYIHPPVDDGECGSCHDPHGSTNFRFLKEPYPESYFAPYSEDTYALCFICHDEEFLLYKRTRQHTEFRDGVRNLHFTHVTQTNNRCTSCHDTHASLHESLIRATSRFGREDAPLNFEPTNTGGSCNPGCHDTLSYDRENPVKKE